MCVESPARWVYAIAMESKKKCHKYHELYEKYEHIGANYEQMTASPCHVSCCQVVDTFHMRDLLLHFCRHAWPVDSFEYTSQTCLYSEVGRVNLHFHTCLKAPWYHDGIPIEDQPILYGQLVTHAEVRVHQCWGILLVFRPSYENSLR